MLCLLSFQNHDDKKGFDPYTGHMVSSCLSLKKKTAKAGSKLRFEWAYPSYVSFRPDRGTGDRETAGVYNDSKKAHGLSAASVRHGCFMEAGVTQSAGSDRLIT